MVPSSTSETQVGFKPVNGRNSRDVWDAGLQRSSGPSYGTGGVDINVGLTVQICIVIYSIHNID